MSSSPQETAPTDNFTHAEARFLEAHAEYKAAADLDRRRSHDYPSLAREDHVYLDYTGGGLYALSQIRRHHELLDGSLFGNPHSGNPTSTASSEKVESARAAVLEFFRASPEEYVAVFTANASSALKLVGEAYPFHSGGRYLLTFDNHNSVNGIREYARAKDAEVTYVPLRLPEMRLDAKRLERELSTASAEADNLFAYPAQSNFSGVRHSLEWIEKAQSHGWDVLLDAAAFTATQRLDLSLVHPDFVCLSFYKMFGYPTGVGCLLARRTAIKKLNRPWFSGGTITVASVQGDRHYMAEGSAAFEDGTVNYLGIPAVEIGLAHLESLGLDKIGARSRALTAWLLETLPQMRHGNGKPLVRLYGPRNTRDRGATVTMNFYDAGGKIIDHTRVEKEAGRANISLRTGCFCNPGGGETALELSRTELIACFDEPPGIEPDRFTLEDLRLCIDGKSNGAVRVSMGAASNFRDVYRFAEFARGFLE